MIETKCPDCGRLMMPAPRNAFGRSDVYKPFLCVRCGHTETRFVPVPEIELTRLHE
jgi:hypothetical protein